MPGILTEFWVAIWSCLFTLSLASISIFDANATLVDYFEDLEYDYDQIPKEGITGHLWLARPYDGCTPIDPPPFQIPSIGWLVLMSMEGCRLNWKLQYAMQSNYSALILVKPPFPSNSSVLGKANSQRDIVVDDYIFDHLIPAVVVTSRAGAKMATHYLYEEETRYIAQLDSYLNNLGHYLWPFVGTIGLLILLVILVMVSRYIRDRRQEQRRRLSSKNLKQIPVHKFKKGDAYELCAICLEPYLEEEKLRVLPCHHAFHCKCVDPWLTKNKRQCPICKRKINRSGGMSDSDSDDDMHSESQSGEETPLLAPPPETSQSCLQRLRERFFRHQTANSASLNSDYGTINDESHPSTSHPNITV